MSYARNIVSVLGGARVVRQEPPDEATPLVSRELCHDLRQPLAALMITASSLLEGQCDPATADGLRRMQAQVTALDEMVQATLTAARPQFVSASCVVESVVSTAAIGRGAHIDFFGAAGEDVVLADVTSLGRAVANLVENAVRAAGEDGAVRVHVVAAAESVDVIIGDTGPGFGGLPRNTGLGLVVVRDFVAEQRGALEFGVSDLGGAEVRVRMPSAFVQTRLGGGFVKILLCDDHVLLLDALATALATSGHQVVATSTLEEVVATAAEMRPDVCLLDVSFPSGSGLDAARTIIAEGSCSKVVMLSANVDTQTLASAALSGAVGFVAKTQGIAEIRDALARVCSGETVVSVPEHRLRVQPAHGGGQEQRLLSFLTEREKDVLRDLVDGHSTTVIAERLGITVNTARTHVQNVLVKLGVHTRLQAAAVVSCAGGPEVLGLAPASTVD